MKWLATAVALTGLAACQGQLLNKPKFSDSIRVQVRDAGGTTVLNKNLTPSSFKTIASSAKDTGGSSDKANSDKANSDKASNNKDSHDKAGHQTSYEVEISQGGSKAGIILPFGPAQMSSESLPLIAACDQKFQRRIPARVLVQISDRLITDQEQGWANYYELVAQQALSRTFDQATIVRAEAIEPIKQLQVELRPVKTANAEKSAESQLLRSLGRGALPELTAEAVLVIGLRGQDSKDASRQMVVRLFDFSFDSYASFGSWERPLIFEEYIEIPTPCTPVALVDAFGEISLSLQNSTRVSRYSNLLASFRTKNQGNGEFTIHKDELNQFLSELFILPENSSVFASGLLSEVPSELQTSDVDAHKQIEQNLLFPCPPAPDPTIEPAQAPQAEVIAVEELGDTPAESELESIGELPESSPLEIPQPEPEASTLLESELLEEPGPSALDASSEVTDQNLEEEDPTP